MSELVLEALNDANIEGYAMARSLTYNNGLAIEEGRRWPTWSDGFVVKSGTEVLGTINVLPLNCTRGEALLKCGGVAGVAVLPESRRGGVGTEMLNLMSRHQRELGVPIVSLYAFRETFYRRCGYEVCGRRLEIHAPTHRLPAGSTELAARRLTPSDWATIAPCHVAFSHTRSGCVVRDEEGWKRHLDEDRPNSIYAVGDPVEGYVALVHQTDFWADQRISDVCWSTRRGYEGCVAILRQLGINKTSLTWFEPSDSPYRARHLDQGVTVTESRPIMFRITDVAGAISQMKTAETGEFRFDVRDDSLAENQGTWRVAYSPERVSVEKGSEPQFSLDVRQLVQAFLGDPSLTDLARNGLVDVQDEVGFRAAERLFTPMPVYCEEFF